MRSCSVLMWRRASLLAFFLLGVLSLFALAIVRGAADAPATSDTAVVESYTRLASHARLLVGAYSRFQWHHPGPLYFYVLAPFYVAAGGKTAGLNAGAGVMAMASMALIGAVLLRRRPRLAIITCAALAVFAWRAAEATASPWNPHVPVLPTAALIVTAADVMAGAFGMLPIVALLASLAGQAHVALIPCVLVVSACAAAGVFVASFSGDRTHDARSALAITAGVVVLAWGLPIYQQLTATPRGNLSELWQFFVVHPPSGQPFSVALSAWADMMIGIVRPDFYPAHGWPFVESPVRWAEALALAAVAAVALQLWWAIRRRQLFETSLCALLVAASGVALWSATRIDDRIFDHDVFWISGIGLLVLAGAFDLLLSVRWRLEPRRPIAVAAVTAMLAVAGLSTATYLRTVVRQSLDPPADARIAGQLAGDLRAYMTREGISRPLIRIDQEAWGVAAGAILALQKQGVRTAVEEDWVVMFTPAFRVNGSEDAIVTVAAPPEHLRLRDRGVPEISSHQPIYAHAERISGR